MAANAETIYVDGSYGEGGGQIVRTSASLAALTGRTLEIRNVRARRSKPGLQAQHLTAVRAAAALCGAALHNDQLGSTFVRMEPAAPSTERAFAIDVARTGASAGATGLVAQTMLVPLALMSDALSSATILGGTHVPMAPTADYIELVYAPTLARLGIDVNVQVERAGFYPRGGGEIRFDVARREDRRPLELTERGRLNNITVVVTTSGLPEHVAARGVEAATKGLAGFGVKPTFLVRDLKSNGAGAAVLIAAECENGIGGFTSLGERGKPMERVAEDAVRAFRKWHASGAAVDEHLADQLVLPCALTPGRSTWTTPEVTNHLRTVLFVASQFLPIEFEIDERANGKGTVTLSA